MQCILLKGSQLCSSKGVYVRNTAKTNMELYKTRGVCYGSVLLSKLMMLPCHSCTFMPSGSPAVLFCIHGADSGTRGAAQGCGASALPCLGRWEWGKNQGVGGKGAPWSQLWWLERREGKNEEGEVWGALGSMSFLFQYFGAIFLDDFMQYDIQISICLCIFREANDPQIISSSSIFLIRHLVWQIPGDAFQVGNLLILLY